MDPESARPWYVVALTLRKGLWNIASEKEYLESEIERLTDEIK